MESILNRIPGGLLTLSKDFEILSLNQRLLQLLRYDGKQLIGQSVRTILPKSSQAFFQFVFYPLLIQKNAVDELSLELMSQQGEEIPVLVYASTERAGTITCVIVPNKKRSQYENQLLEAKEVAENSLIEKNKVNTELKVVLKNLEEKQAEISKFNQQNFEYKMATQKELQLAKKIQETTLTKEINNPQLQINSFYKASNELSGDIYGFYQINEHQFGIILLDVMGHGISSALITMSLETLFQRLISKGVSANRVMKELDQQLHSLVESDKELYHYCTAIYIFIDTKKQTIEYINAGHPPAIYLDSNGRQKELKTTVPPIGLFKGMNFHSSTFSYKKGARLLLYTDGVSEPLGEDRLSSLLRDSTSLSLEHLKEKLSKALREEGNNCYNNDDQCFILIDLK